ncbi:MULTISPECIES: type II secretion system F family protein [unclassified Devosia]|jgi:tight adherence protein C|uniref:type II secretion system F family protein n=1 Tax=unclassified Devosia TaxID=196773 RepID=UPI00086C82B8|nr:MULTISPECIES: type II secretion system F family protein [unclassified Devosia]MBN9363072.1 type II secretion system F family protein [Devosia sp.]ODS94388.1 MAG: type II secretion system protein [Devosia sp. SCN 66-27]OJX23429.1 MAG: type II secretion system protein [Devosia sp. 66-14]
MDLVATLTNTQFLVAVLAAVAAAAVVFSIGATFFSGNSQMRQRIRRVALEREKLRAEEMARLRGTGAGNGDQPRTIRHAAGRDYMKNIVERFSLEKAFMDESTAEKLARAGYRGQAAMTTFLFLRFVTPVVLFFLAFAYLSFSVFADKPLWLNAVYALGIALIGAYLPSILLKNKTIKRQQSIKRSWPDALDLVLLCVEAGMSVEHALKRVAKEIGAQSVELAEEMTLTTAELAFLEDRTRAYENLGRRTGLDNVKSVMQALIQAERHGTSVGQALRVMAEEGREARMMEAEKKAAALPPKLTVPLIVFFLPVLFIVILSPAIIRVFSNSFFSGGG